MNSNKKDRQLAAWQLVCAACGATYDFAPLVRGCPACSTTSEPRLLELHFRPDEIPQSPSSRRSGRGLMRYLDLLPVDGERFVSLGEGGTPLLPSQEIGPSLGLKRLFFKNDTANPTWSFKDRYVATSIAAAHQFGFRNVVVTSTGNLGISTAAYCARARLGCHIVAPDDMPTVARSRAEALGATILTVTATERQRTFESLSHQDGWFPLGLFLPRAVSNPFGVEGYKTFAYELIEALGDAPAAVLFPCARGNGLYGTWKGFCEAREWGWTDTAPRMIACQPRGADSLVISLRQGTTQPIELPPFASVAHSASESIGSEHALRALSASGGDAIAVDEGEIVAAQAELARSEGLLVEASSALVIAGLRALAKRRPFDPEQTIVCVLTGPGFVLEQQGAT
jgi:threonine synthase